VKFHRPVVKLSLIAHVLAWAAFLFMAFWPSFYQGTTTTPVGPDGSGGEIVSYSASVIEVNGWGVLVPLLAPVALTAAGLLISRFTDTSTFTSKFLMWTFTALLVVFCALGVRSIGMFYLPAALALLAAAVMMTIKSTPRVKPNFGTRS
jgi:hypothetical protein